MADSHKTIWFVNYYGSTPETSIGGRHYYLARELVRLGYNVHLIAASYTHLLSKPPVVVTPIQIEKVEGINITYVKLNRYNNAHSKKRIVNEFMFSWKLTRLFRQLPEKPDVILCSSPSLISFLGVEYVASKFENTSLCFEVRDIWPLTLIELGGYSRYHPFVLFLQWIERRAYKKSAQVISNLPYAARHMVRHGLDPRKFTWIPNGFTTKIAGTKKDLTDEFLEKIPQAKMIVGYTGTLGKANALDVLLDTAELLKTKKEIQFVIVGSGKEAEFLVNEIKLRELDNVKYMGAVPKNQIPSVLDLFDVCFAAFHKNRLYQFGTSLNKLPEYFISGKPIVYSVDSPYQPVKEACAGFTLPAEDSTGIANAIIQLYEMGKDARIKLGQNGYEYALKNHDYKILAKRFINIFFNR
ncbi:MAG: glycosyltransferase WbuB [Desulfobulbus propionicus]|nr:MAG: glycosyltransferase WbuB [Desulfobulbus propionicus]